MLDLSLLFQADHRSTQTLVLDRECRTERVTGHHWPTLQHVEHCLVQVGLMVLCIERRSRLRYLQVDGLRIGGDERLSPLKRATRD